MLHDVNRRLKSCPSCGTTISWLDGEASPGLHGLYSKSLGRWIPLECDLCVGKSVLPTEEEKAALKRKAEKEALRKVAAQASKEIGSAAELIVEGMEIAGKVGAFLRKLAR